MFPWCIVGAESLLGVLMWLGVGSGRARCVLPLAGRGETLPLSLGPVVAGVDGGVVLGSNTCAHTLDIGKESRKNCTMSRTNAPAIWEESNVEHNHRKHTGKQLRSTFRS